MPVWHFWTWMLNVDDDVAFPSGGLFGLVSPEGNRRKIPSLKRSQQGRPWKWMVGIRSGFLLGFGLFSGAFAVSFREGRWWKVVFSRQRFFFGLQIRGSMYSFLSKILEVQTGPSGDIFHSSSREPFSASNDYGRKRNPRFLAIAFTQAGCLGID